MCNCRHPAAAVAVPRVGPTRYMLPARSVDRCLRAGEDHTAVTGSPGRAGGGAAIGFGVVRTQCKVVEVVVIFHHLGMKMYGLGTFIGAEIMAERCHMGWITV